MLDDNDLRRRASRVTPSRLGHQEPLAVGGDVVTSAEDTARLYHISSLYLRWRARHPAVCTDILHFSARVIVTAPDLLDRNAPLTFSSGQLSRKQRQRSPVFAQVVHEQARPLDCRAGDEAGRNRDRT